MYGRVRPADRPFACRDKSGADLVLPRGRGENESVWIDAQPTEGTNCHLGR